MATARATAALTLPLCGITGGLATTWRATGSWTGTWDGWAGCGRGAGRNNMEGSLLPYSMTLCLFPYRLYLPCYLCAPCHRLTSSLACTSRTVAFMTFLFPHPNCYSTPVSLRIVNGSSWCSGRLAPLAPIPPSCKTCLLLLILHWPRHITASRSPRSTAYYHCTNNSYLCGRL